MDKDPSVVTNQFCFVCW